MRNRMSDSLIIVGENARACEEYFRVVHDYRADYSNIVMALDGNRIRGFSDVDILFLRGWWNLKNCREILDTLSIYIMGKNCIIGDKLYVPPYFYDFGNRSIVAMDQIESRFDILDL
jgi:hypothetical protein